MLKPWILVSVAAAALLTAGAASAQDNHGHPSSSGHAAPAHSSHESVALHYDTRYHHDHYYPRVGFVGVLPGGAVSVGWHGGSYYYHGGVWWRPYGPRFVVVAPPFGIVVPLLPPAYTTLWIGGAPYYYANGAYYAPAPGEGYRVVEPPPGAEAAQPAPAPKPMPDPIVYPRNNQNAQQTEADRQECNRWATTQPNAMADASVFQRAVAACMDGRGYTVR